MIVKHPDGGHCNTKGMTDECYGCVYYGRGMTDECEDRNEKLKSKSHQSLNVFIYKTIKRSKI